MEGEGLRRAVRASGFRVEHMQNYLELLPNAPDAQSARDQLDLWQLKAKEQMHAGAK